MSNKIIKFILFVTVVLVMLSNRVTAGIPPNMNCDKSCETFFKNGQGQEALGTYDNCVNQCEKLLSSASKIDQSSFDKVEIDKKWGKKQSFN